MASDGTTNEWTRTYTDFLGRSWKTLHATNGATYPTDQTLYNYKGELWKQADPDGVATLHTNLSFTERCVVVDSDRDNVVDWSGPDRISKTLSDVYMNTNVVLKRTRSYVYPTNTTTTLLTSTVETSADGLRRWQTAFGQTTVQETTYPATGTRMVTVTAPDLTKTVSLHQYGRLVSEATTNASGAQLSKTTYAYDAHGRLSTSTDARNGATTYTYNNADQVESTTTPAPGTGASAQTMTTSYDGMVRPWKTTYADGTSLTNEFWPSGALKRTSGNRAYPTGYGYDAQGRMTKMTNWSGFIGGTGPRVTTWNYNAYRGWLDSKRDAASQGASYTYTAAGRLKTRTWARGVVTTSAYTDSGDLSTVTYSDSTPGATYNYDRQGRIMSVVQGSGGSQITTSYGLSDAGLRLSEAYSGGLLAGLTVTNGYDTCLRRTSVWLNSPTPLTTTFGYDVASRLTNVSDGVYNAGYTYLANSRLVGQITFRHTTNVMITTRQYHWLNRLRQTLSSPTGPNQPPWVHGYEVNAADQRTRIALGDGSYWVYEYDSLGQVKSGKRFWNDGTPVAGQQFEYAFDDIGNRNSTKAGGDQVGGSLRSASYTNNTLNQIIGRGVPSAVDVIGVAIPAAAVSVNGSTNGVYRRGDYFRRELSATNSTGPQWLPVGVTATSGGTNTVWPTGYVLVPPAGQTFLYDADGNLTNDSVWSYTWDAENRLVQMTNTTSVTTSARKKLVFQYDHQARRIRKTVYPWGATDYSTTPSVDNKFLYDQWNLLAELNATNNAVIRSCMWGVDLSGSEQGAGGVGGLLRLTYFGASTTNAFVACDGNGNVMGLVDANGGTNVAEYIYGPFAEPLVVTGPLGKLNPFRFSTKYTDEETDLLYYGYRYYSVSAGRWLRAGQERSVGAWWQKPCDRPTALCRTIRLPGGIS